MKVALGNIPQSTTVAFKLNGLDRAPGDYDLYYQTADGTMKQFEGQWQLLDAMGREPEHLSAHKIYELQILSEDNAGADTDPDPKDMVLGVILVTK